MKKATLDYFKEKSIYYYFSLKNGVLNCDKWQVAKMKIFLTRTNVYNFKPQSSGNDSYEKKVEEMSCFWK